MRNIILITILLAAVSAFSCVHKDDNDKCDRAVKYGIPMIALKCAEADHGGYADYDTCVSNMFFQLHCLFCAMCM